MPIIDPGDKQPSQAQLFADAVHQALKDGSVAGHFGRKFLKQHGESRRVIWVPVGGPISLPPIASDRVAVEGKLRAPAAAVCEETLLAHVYAETPGRVEQLKNDIIAATKRQLYTDAPSANPSSYAWTSQEEAEAGVTNRTELIVITMTLRLTVPEKFKQLRRATGFADECGTLDEAGNLVPQP